MALKGRPSADAFSTSRDAPATASELVPNSRRIGQASGPSCCTQPNGQVRLGSRGKGTGGRPTFLLGLPLMFLAYLLVES